MVDFKYFLNRKYQILQEQADATTRNAKTGAEVGSAAANLDRTRAQVLPAESRANIAQTNAQTNLLGEQAAVVRPSAFANIRLQDAQTGLTRTQDQVEQTLGLQTFSPTTPLGSVFGASGPPRFRLSGAITGRQPKRRAGESEVDYLDRINGL